MKIAILGTAYPFRGGLAAYNERLARQFISEGHEVSVFTFTTQYPGFLFPGKSQFIGGPPPQGLNIFRTLSSVNPFTWIRTGLRLRREKPDFIIIKYWLPFMGPALGTVARIASGGGRCRVITILDNVIPHEKRPGDRLLTRYFISAVHGAVAMSGSVMDDLYKFRRNIPAALNPHPLFDNFGAPLERKEALARLNLDQSFSYILFFGFVRAYKGLDLLIEAFSDKCLRTRKIKLIVAGEFYDNEKPYLELIENRGIGDEVSLFDRFIGDDEVAVFFSASDLVVQPYRNATQSGVTQIAYHFDKPMIVTDVGGLKEIVPNGRCGYVVGADPGEIAAAINDFFSSGRRDEFITNVKEEKKKYLWSKMTGTILNIYNQTVSNDNKK
ncbi:MAG TPA: glycosyltransferase [Bacteroidales bacterium]|nr:glycosyltransferase [Bacteroidales bacterium]